MDILLRTIASGEQEGDAYDFLKMISGSARIALDQLSPVNEAEMRENETHLLDTPLLRPTSS